MIYAGLALLTLGLLLGVFAMLNGTQRRVRDTVAPHERRSEHDPAAEPSALLNIASIAAFSVGAGLTVYLVARASALPWWAVTLVGIAAGGLALALQSLLIARWAIPSARSEHVDHRYLLQGTIGEVLRTVLPGAEGRMRYTLDGQSYDIPARSVTDAMLPAGSEVVIDRVEDGVAYVESWAVVEQRL